MVEYDRMNRTSDRLDARVMRDGWPPTGWVALVGFTLFLSGFFLLAVAGRAFDLRVYALVLGGAATITVPILLLGLLVTLSESVVGRAWASGFRALGSHERHLAGTAARGLRYAGFLWMANGVALWVVTFTTSFG